MNSIKGLIYGIVTSVTFGLIPLFTLPLMKEGMSLDSILFYRFLFATIALGIMMKVHKEPFAIKMNDLPLLVLLSTYYMVSAQFLFWGYDYMGAGVATTLHFTYPVFVTLLMLILFREKASWVTWLAIILAVYGVARLSIGGEDHKFSFFGVGIVLLSALGYAAYITTVNKSHLRTMPNRKLAFYVFVFTTLLFAGKVSVTQTLQPIPDVMSGVNLVLLAVLPTVISNITLLLAVHHIGGTMTSVLGALEPVTAVCIGAFVFGEAFTWQQGLGIAMILVAVTLIILGKPIQNTLSSVVKLIRPRHS
ncbi:DMT family transporter [Bacteroides sp. OF04-15BH]|jgi:drug/metabolite transporter (DMT)-like permease|uniref:DMT family transporter n=1 Tax=Bacteroides sp. OF04-15BH TaxID=2292281 RepID=UPI000E5368E1|nr:DMT family transporter [Bacteroides sp. OF04-15BH]RHP63242.1 DMT family transporter [Bacteroides sp. OF04-15BH]